MSFPSSRSGRYRGGFFPYYFGDRLCNEWGLFFRRPAILQAAGGSNRFVDAFPAINLSPESRSSQRLHFSAMKDIVSDVARNLHAAGVLNAEPRLLD